MLRVVDVEHRVRQKLGLSGHLRFFNVHGRRQGRRSEVRRLAAVECSEQIVDIFQRGRFVKRDGHMVVINLTDVDFRLSARRNNRVRTTRALQSHRVKVRVRRPVEAHLLGAFFKDLCQTVRLLGDVVQAFRAVVDGIHGRHVCQQSLRCANVRRRFVSANVLFSRLHRHSQARIPICIDGNTDNSPGIKRLYSSVVAKKPGGGPP